jgi:hypothetical protein
MRLGNSIRLGAVAASASSQLPKLNAWGGDATGKLITGLDEAPGWGEFWVLGCPVALA